MVSLFIYYVHNYKFSLGIVKFFMRNWQINSKIYITKLLAYKKMILRAIGNFFDGLVQFFTSTPGTANSNYYNLFLFLFLV